MGKHNGYKFDLIQLQRLELLDQIIYYRMKPLSPSQLRKSEKLSRVIAPSNTKVHSTGSAVKYFHIQVFIKFDKAFTTHSGSEMHFIPHYATTSRSALHSSSQ